MIHSAFSSPTTDPDWLPAFHQYRLEFLISIKTTLTLHLKCLKMVWVLKLQSPNISMFQDLKHIIFLTNGYTGANKTQNGYCSRNQSFLLTSGHYSHERSICTHEWSLHNITSDHYVAYSRVDTLYSRAVNMYSCTHECTLFSRAVTLYSRVITLYSRVVLKSDTSIPILNFFSVEVSLLTSILESHDNESKSRNWFIWFFPWIQISPRIYNIFLISRTIN